MPIATAANVAQGAAALAVAFKTKNHKTKALALPASLSAFMGITEPAIFGVNVRYGYTDASVLGISVKGSFDGWATTNKMTKTSAEGAAFVFEFTYQGVLEGDYTFGFIEYSDEAGQTQVAWHSGTDGQNVPVTIVAGTTTYTFAGSFAGGIAAKAA